jgi:hypothetical protein
MLLHSVPDEVRAAKRSQSRRCHVATELKPFAETLSLSDWSPACSSCQTGTIGQVAAGRHHSADGHNSSHAPDETARGCEANKDYCRDPCRPAQLLSVRPAAAGRLRPGRASRRLSTAVGTQAKSTAIVSTGYSKQMCQETSFSGRSVRPENLVDHGCQWPRDRVEQVLTACICPFVTGVAGAPQGTRRTATNVIMPSRTIVCCA